MNRTGGIIGYGQFKLAPRPGVKFEQKFDRKKMIYTLLASWVP